MAVTRDRITLAAFGAVSLAVLASPAHAQRSLFDQPLATDPPVAAPVQTAAPAPVAPPAVPAAPVAQAQATAPAPPTVREEKPRPAPRSAAAKPRSPTPARSLVINNATAATLASLEISGDGKVARLPRPLAAKKKATLKLPAMTSCTVTVAAAFEGQQGAAPTSDLDICKEKTVRFTD